MKQKLNTCVLSLLSLAYFPLTSGANTGIEFPETSWSTPPSEMSVLSAETVQQAVDALSGIVGNDGVSGTMLIHKGYVLWEGDRTDEMRPIWSCTKSILSTCLGLLWDEGKCTPDDLAWKYLPELKENYPEVTLRHLATFTSGLHVENYSLEVGPPDYSVGTAMHYSGQSDILAYILTRIAGESLEDLFKRRIADPIGMDPDGWEWKSLYTREGLRINGGAGFPNNGMHMTAQNLARFGWLYANRGSWDGNQLISCDYIDYATKPLVPADIALHEANGWYYVLPGIYGLNWWTNGIDFEGNRLWEHAPDSTFAAQGNRNNICIIVPEWKLVLVRTGSDRVIDVSLYDQPLSILAEGLSRSN